MTGWHLLLPHKEDSESPRVNIDELHKQVALAWCEENGYTEPFRLKRDWWAFPPGAVLPVPLSDYLEEPLCDAFLALVKQIKSAHS